MKTNHKRRMIFIITVFLAVAVFTSCGEPKNEFVVTKIEKADSSGMSSYTAEYYGGNSVIFNDKNGKFKNGDTLVLVPKGSIEYDTHDDMSTEPTYDKDSIE